MWKVVSAPARVLSLASDLRPVVEGPAGCDGGTRQVSGSRRGCRLERGEGRRRVGGRDPAEHGGRGGDRRPGCGNDAPHRTRAARRRRRRQPLHHVDVLLAEPDRQPAVAA